MEKHNYNPHARPKDRLELAYGHFREGLIDPNAIQVEKKTRIGWIQGGRKPPLGFYILRHMSCNDSMEFWHIAYTRIRQLYANIPIVIIDDNSRKHLVKNGTNQKREKEARLENTRFESYPKYSGRGELLSYYAFQKNHPFEKAVFLHDTTFLNGKPVDFDAVEGVKYMWYFDDHSFDDPKNERRIIDTLGNKSKEAVKSLYNNRTGWHGCFGVLSVMDHTALSRIVMKYELFNVLSIVSTRTMRKAMERVFAVLCTLEQPSLATSPAILGNILDEPMRRYIKSKYTFEEYRREIGTSALNNLTLVKVWSGACRGESYGRRGAKTAPAKAVPPKTAPAKTAPAQAVPAKTVSPKAVPPKAVPPKAIPAQGVPVMKTVKNNSDQ